MSWTVVEDNAAIQVRATIFEAKELDELIEALKKRREKLSPQQELSHVE